MNIGKTTFWASVLSMLGLWCGLLAVNAVFVFLLAPLFQWLWNAVLPSLAATPRLSYVQSAELLGLVLLLRTVLRGAQFKFRARL